MKTITAHNNFQGSYTYSVTEKAGYNFDESFTPDLSPYEMINLGIFGGYYSSVNDHEFPNKWFDKNDLQSTIKDPQKNLFKVNASQSLATWKEKGWIYNDDPQGWFLWYCRYYMGRRLPEEDARQIKRWKAMKRHIAQIKKNCQKKDLSCRKKQRQALLHWAYDSRKI